MIRIESQPYPPCPNGVITLKIHLAFCLFLLTAQANWVWGGPVRLVYDTDIGNDVDDVLALGMIHSLESKGLCRLLSVTITKDHYLSAPFTDAVNTFYGRGEIPIGVVRDGPTKEASKFTELARADSGFRYPHDLRNGNQAQEAVSLLREILVEQPDNSVVAVQVGFSTNLNRLLHSPPDQYSPLNGLQLVRQKVKLLSMMGGSFSPIRGNTRFSEYNIRKDIFSAKGLIENWPTQIVLSGFEIGLAITYPAQSIQKDFGYVEYHPIAEAYWLYNPPPHNRPTWDLTSVLYAVMPERGFFDLSDPGRVVVEDDGHTKFNPNVMGLHRYLKINEDQIIRIREALVHLASQPPDRRADSK